MLIIEKSRIMLKLVICIEMLIGYYNIIVDEDRILTVYFPDSLESAPRLVSTLDGTSNHLYRYENNSLVSSKHLESRKPNANVKTLSFQPKEEIRYIAGLECQKYEKITNIKDYLNGSGNADLVTEVCLADAGIIDKYVPERHRGRLSFIGSNYPETKQYTLEVMETTHDEAMLISRVISIDEVRELPPALDSLLKR